MGLVQQKDPALTLDGHRRGSYDRVVQLSSKESSMAEPSYEELKARLAELEKQVETRKRTGSLEFRVSEKGGVSVYGLGRFPVTLYYEQWIRLLDAAEELRRFLEENKDKLKLKGQ
jgi:hypothetical protein